MYKWLAAGCAIGFGIGLFLASLLFETWLSPFGNPITIGYTIWNWGSQTNFWKFMGLLWLISGIAGVYLLYQGTEKTKHPQEPSKNTQKTYMEIAGEPTHQGFDRTTVAMASMEDLQKVANTIKKPILHQKLPPKTTEKNPSHVFYILDGSTLYQFTKTPPSPETLPSTTTAISSISPPTAPPQKTHLIIKHRYKLALGSTALAITFIAIYLAGFLPWLPPPPIPPINLTLPALPALPTLPTTSSKELIIALVILGISTAIGLMTIISQKMKRKQPH